MTISDELKTNLVADVENICELELNNDAKIALQRCFEITIGTYFKQFENDNKKIAFTLSQVKELLAQQRYNCQLERIAKNTIFEDKTGTCYISSEDILNAPEPEI